MSLLRSRFFQISAGFVSGACIMLSLLIFFRPGLSEPTGSVVVSPVPSPGVSETPDNVSLYLSAAGVAASLYAGDYSALSSWVSQESGLMFVPFSTVEFDRNLVFTPIEVKGFADNKNTYLWGVEPGTGVRLERTPAQFTDETLRTLDYSQASVIGIRRVMKTGNAPENVAEAFQDGYFVDFYYPPSEQGGTDWSSLKVVFANENGRLRLIALVRGVYTAQ